MSDSTATAIAPPRMTALEHGVEAGVRWSVCRAPLYGAVNGYARLPEGHQWHAADLQGSDYDNVRVHGGVTFGPTADGWVGFDTLHSGDRWPDEDSHHCTRYGERCTCHLWTQAEVVAEAKSLARQIAAADPAHPEAVSA